MSNPSTISRLHGIARALASHGGEDFELMSVAIEGYLRGEGKIDHLLEKVMHRLRDKRLMGTAARFFGSLSQNKQSMLLHQNLRRYAAGDWKKDRSDGCQAQPGTLRAALFSILIAREEIPGPEAIRKILGKRWHFIYQPNHA